jgi:beta-lactam-binding protein with PASTA domain
MSKAEEEHSDVVVVLVDQPGMTMADAIEQLKSAGLEVSDTDGDNDVVEGTILTAKIGAIKKLTFVKYVRDVFDYYSEKDDEEAQSGDLDDVDDAR